MWIVESYRRVLWMTFRLLKGLSKYRIKIRIYGLSLQTRVGEARDEEVEGSGLAPPARYSGVHLGTYNTVKARFWPWRQAKDLETFYVVPFLLGPGCERREMRRSRAVVLPLPAARCSGVLRSRSPLQHNPVK